jgi:hypothetical protein
MTTLYQRAWYCQTNIKTGDRALGHLNCTICKETEVNFATVLLCELVRKSVERSHGGKVNVMEEANEH